MSQRHTVRQVQKGSQNGMAPVLLGLSAGIVMAMLLARLITSLLFQVSTFDVMTFLTSPLALALAGAPGAAHRPDGLSTHRLNIDAKNGGLCLSPKGRSSLK